MSPTHIAVFKYQRRIRDRLHARLALPNERTSSRIVAAFLVVGLVAAVGLAYFVSVAQ